MQHPHDAMPGLKLAERVVMTPQGSRFSGLLHRLGRLKGPIAAIAGTGAILSGFVGWYTAYKTVSGNGSALPALSSPAGTAESVSALSIVVLPFANLTGDASQEYLAEGLAAALTADLSRIEGAFVIDSASAQSYKGKAQTAQQIGEALKVRFVLQGNVQRSGEQIRINASLAEAKTNAQVWSDNFVGKTSDVFALQDQVTGRIANTMGHELVVVAARESEKRKATPQVSDLMLRARALADKPHSLEKWEEIERLYRQAMRMDPDNVNAMAGLATALTFKRDQITETGLREKIWDEVLPLATKVQAIDPAMADPYRIIAFHRLEKNDVEGARRSAETFMRLRPRFPEPYNVMGRVYSRMGDAGKAVEMFTKAVELSRKDSTGVFPVNLARAYFMQGNYTAAIQWNRNAIQIEPQNYRAHLGLALTYAMQGDMEKTQLEVQEVQRLRPGYKVHLSELRDRSNSPAYKTYIEEKLIPACRIAGLLEP